MTKHQLYRFARRAARDWSLTPVLRDALLEHPSTADVMARAVAWAEEMSTNARRQRRYRGPHVVILRPAFLSREVARRRNEYGSLFSVYEVDLARYDSVAAVVESLQFQTPRDTIVPVYVSTSGRQRPS